MEQLMESNIAFAILILIIGFVFLVKGADFFVDGSSSIAKKLKVPSIIIGLTIVAMGTSLPETAVSVTASLIQNNTLAISNVTGSNIFNSMVVVGVCAVMSPIAVNPDTIRRDIPFSVFCAALLLGLCAIGMTLGHIDGIILLVLFVGFILNMIRLAMKSRRQQLSEETHIAGNRTIQASAASETPAGNADVVQSANPDDIPSDNAEEEIRILPTWKSLLFIVLGIIGIALGGDWVVDSASVIATALGMSQTLVGLTIVSIGTSLPELVTSIVAAHKKEVDMALGNAFGSNVFNILMVLGIAAAISPVAVITENIIDLAVLIVISILIWIMARTNYRIGRKEGIAMVAVYAVYVVYIILR